MTYEQKVYGAIWYAVERAIAEVGIEGLKKTSLFLSNHKDIED